ncbi:hypothetical protein ACHAWC_000028, partial [Mediolabrus comicus]
MSERSTPSGQLAFAVGLLAGSIATLLLTTSLRKNKSDDADALLNPSNASQNSYNVVVSQNSMTMPDEIRSEMLSRNSLYFASSN